LQLTNFLALLLVLQHRASVPHVPRPSRRAAHRSGATNRQLRHVLALLVKILQSTTLEFLALPPQNLQATNFLALLLLDNLLPTGFPDLLLQDLYATNFLALLVQDSQATNFLALLLEDLQATSLLTLMLQNLQSHALATRVARARVARSAAQRWHAGQRSTTGRGRGGLDRRLGLQRWLR
jgi:hypothetical protein